MSKAILTRRVEAETLDHLREDDPRAVRSRRDLRRINRIMGNVSIIDSLLTGSLAHPPSRIAELGAGDGSLALALARRHLPAWPRVTLTLVDRQSLLDAPTRAAFMDLGWTVHAAAIDVFDWAERVDHPRYDAIVANLFLHHFEADALLRLFRAIARITGCFVACEPRRARAALLGSHLVGAIGANAVTRHDAVLSVRAGFQGREISECWPGNGAWQLSEEGAWLFSHKFSAVLRAQA